MKLKIQKRGKTEYFFVPYLNDWMTIREMVDLKNVKLSRDLISSRIQTVKMGYGSFKDFKDLLHRKVKTQKIQSGYDIQAILWPAGSLANTVR